MEALEVRTGGRIHNTIVCQDMHTSKELFRFLPGKIQTVNLESLSFTEISQGQVRAAKDMARSSGGEAWFPLEHIE